VIAVAVAFVDVVAGLLAQVTQLDRFEEFLVRLIDADLAPRPAGGAPAGAAGAGAARALAPGHAKTVTAAYLVSARGRPRDALAIGAIVSGMHTGSVLVLGLLLYGAMEGPFTHDRLVPWMTLLSGVLILAVGVGLVVRQVRLRLRGGHGGHDHGLSHLPDHVSPFSLRGVVVIGLAGGLIPSPSAFLVLATAIFIDRLLLGLALVAAFSIGLAATIAGVGWLAIRGRDVLAARREASPRVRRVAAALPVASSVVVVIGGVVLTALAVVQMA
jgi:nickel/cobalt transporter (NicO) family protein